MTGSPRPLTERERAALAAACDAFHPSLAPEGTDDPTLFSASATSLGVPRAAEDAIDALAPSDRQALLRLLRLLGGPLLGLTIGKPRRLSAMKPADRERLLRSMATSRIPPLRSGFQALRRLSSFLYYSTTDKTGHNVVWPRIGYTPSPRGAVGASSVRSMRYDTDATVDCDVCVVGSGAGGGTVAGELSTRGYKIVLIESGPGDQAPNFSQGELDGTRRLYLDRGLTATRDLGVAILAGSCLGGGTTVNWQTCLRTPDYIRDEWDERSGCGLFTSDRFTRALDLAAIRLGASPDESEVNPNNAAIRRGCESLGYDWSVTARNARGCDTEQCGYCIYGCRAGGKQSTVVTYLQTVPRKGRSTIVTDCRADRLIIERNRVEGVIAKTLDAAGSLVTTQIRAKVVVVCAGGIGTPALLERSGVSLPQLGRNFFVHPTTAVAGVYADPIEAWRGPPQSIMSAEFARVAGNFGFRLEAAPVHPGLLSIAAPWTSPRAHRRLMQRAAHVSAMIALTRDSSGGQVRARPDGSVRIDYKLGKAERALVTRGISAAARVHLAAGADEVHTLHTRGLTLAKSASPTEVDAFYRRIENEPVDRNWSSLFSAHQMGTCRMGTDGSTAVCDERGRVFGVSGLYVADASAFPASSGVNPMLTVVAIATCVAEGIANGEE
jgi:choline dehydrogenase-like flavoprotein